VYEGGFQFPQHKYTGQLVIPDAIPENLIIFSRADVRKILQPVIPAPRWKRKVVN